MGGGDGGGGLGLLGVAWEVWGRSGDGNFGSGFVGSFIIVVHPA